MTRTLTVSPSGSIQYTDSRGRQATDPTGLSLLSPSSPELGLLPPVVKYISPWAWDHRSKCHVSLVIVEGKPTRHTVCVGFGNDDEPEIFNIPVPWHHWFIYLTGMSTTDPSSWKIYSVSQYWSQSQIYDQDHLFFSPPITNILSKTPYLTRADFLDIQKGFPYFRTDVLVTESHRPAIKRQILNFLHNFGYVTPDNLDQLIADGLFGDDGLFTLNEDRSITYKHDSFSTPFVTSSHVSHCSVCFGYGNVVARTEQESLASVFQKLCSSFWASPFNSDAILSYNYHNASSLFKFFASLSVDDMIDHTGGIADEMIPMMRLSDVINSIEDPSIYTRSITDIFDSMKAVSTVSKKTKDTTVTASNAQDILNAVGVANNEAL
jgi:hypothetical protein